MNDGIPNQPDPFPITADVLLNFTVYVEVDEANSSHVLKGRLQNYFGKAFAEKLMISHDRISDVNVVYAGNETFNTEVCKGYAGIKKIFLILSLVIAIFIACFWKRTQL